MAPIVFPLPGLPDLTDLPGLIGLPTGQENVEAVLDKLNPDQKAKLSAIGQRTGWGSPSSKSNGMMRAVVKRESAGDPKARNPKSGAVGLMQMMTGTGGHCGQFGSPAAKGHAARLPDNDPCVRWYQDPDNNLRAAKRYHAQAGWSPWAASGGVPEPTNWDPMIVTDKDTIIDGAGQVAGAVVSPFAAVAEAAVDLIGALLSKDTWFRIGKGWLGGVLIVTGTGALVLIIANRASNGGVTKAAKVAVTKGVVK